MSKVLPWVALIAVIVYFSLKEGCNGEDGEAGKQDTLWISVEKQETPVNVTFTPKTPINEIHYHVPEGQSFDSAAIYDIIESYYTRREYRDSILNDTIKINWSAVIKENKLDTLDVSYHVLKPWVTNAILPPLKKKNVFEVKTMIGGDRDHFVAALGGGIRHKKGYDIGGMYDIVNKGVYVTFDTPLRLPKLPRIFKKRTD